MKIGNVFIKTKFVLAPMAGINCTAFRMLCKEDKAGLIYTQRIDSSLINNKNKKEVKKYLNIHDSEHPVSVQLIGSDEKELIKSVKLVEDFADIIDFNVGCSEPEFLKKGCGASLLSDLDKLKRIVQSIVNSTKKPVTAKIRIGIDSQTINGVMVSELLEYAGVKALCVHGRTAQQKYSGKVNWTIMKQIKEKISIPVIANGDIKSYDDGLEMLGKTGCDLVMIGREAKHRPWVFNPDKTKLDNKGIKEEILRFIELYEKYESRQNPREAAEHVYWMLRDFKTKENMKEFLKIRNIEKIKKDVYCLK